MLMVVVGVVLSGGSFSGGLAFGDGGSLSWT